MRNLRIDVARGMLMVYIITIVHGFYFLNVYSGPGKSLVLFEMPCIFFISGYAYALSLQGGMRMDAGRDYWRYLKTRAARILIPYWLYALVCLGLVLLKADPGLTGSAGAKLATAAAWLNPLQYGSGHTVSLLNYHLWFVAPFLGVTVLMPLLVKAVSWKKMPLPALLLAAAALIFGGELLLAGELSKSVLTYSVWAVLGYAVGSRQFGAMPSRARMLLVFAVACVLLLAASAMSWATLDMQHNKFPPNTAFFMFSLAWFSLLWVATSFLGDGAIARLRAMAWFRPFADKGYSIYMWQGLAYSLAFNLGQKFHLPLMAVWLAAIVLAFALGIAASPAEALGKARGRGPKGGQEQLCTITKGEC
ncbi:acyltransferase [Pseudoduganella sp. LjRoot289]|uniref:acyltransferase family protein n=1 Tax=Pseudoduganella sp. LjRoot289 TaxID=3342314 RepID=UPI003ECF9114